MFVIITITSSLKTNENLAQRLYLSVNIWIMSFNTVKNTLIDVLRVEKVCLQEGMGGNQQGGGGGGVLLFFAMPKAAHYQHEGR